MWQELENRVFKTRFIIQKNFKNLPSLKHGLTSPDRIRSEGKSQIREGEKEIAQARLGRTTWGSRDPGRATWVARPRPRDPGRTSLGRTASSHASLGLFLLLR